MSGVESQVKHHKTWEIHYREALGYSGKRQSEGIFRHDCEEHSSKEFSRGEEV
jgi:hypothetical protein